jgi:hypothetical protein
MATGGAAGGGPPRGRIASRLAEERVGGDGNLARAIAVATSAVQLDHAGRHPEAYELYTEAVERFLPYTRQGTNQKVIIQRVQGYLARAEELKAAIREREDAPKPPGEQHPLVLAAGRCAELALEAETAGNYAQATESYTKAIDHFMSAAEIVEREGRTAAAAAGGFPPPSAVGLDRRQLVEKIEALFARAEQVKALAKAAAEEERRAPLARARGLQTEAEQAEAQGEAVQAFDSYCSAIGWLFKVSTRAAGAVTQAGAWRSRSGAGRRRYRSGAVVRCPGLHL